MDETVVSEEGILELTPDQRVSLRVARLVNADGSKMSSAARAAAIKRLQEQRVQCEKCSNCSRLKLFKVSRGTCAVCAGKKSKQSSLRESAASAVSTSTRVGGAATQHIADLDAIRKANALLIKKFEHDYNLVPKHEKPGFLWRLGHAFGVWDLPERPPILIVDDIEESRPDSRDGQSICALCFGLPTC
eukprot:m.270458 g.270458  ORF g.270458 m.270458 type:complete len:189 (+) comp16080_c0_seq3:349-915(+)